MSQKNKKPNSKVIAKPQGNYYAALAGILIITFLVFINTLTPNFIQLDDPSYIIDNPFIKSLSIKNISTIFSAFYNANYHPITTLSYAIEFKLFGLKATGYHFTNIVLHLINTLLVFVLILKISKRKEIAIISALFFGIHPIHVESVAWISERKDLLYSMFYLGALYYYYEYIHNNKSKYFVIAILLFLLSLLSKSAAITLPLVLCAFDYYYQRSFNKKVIFEKIPFFALSILFGIITILSQKSAGAIDADLMPKYSLIERFFVVSYATCFYLLKLIFPFGLSALHYAPKKLPDYFYVMPLVLIVLAFWAWKTKWQKREIIFGLLFFFFSICLTLQIIPIGYAIVSERYSYISYIGLFFILGYFYVSVIDGKILNGLKSSIKYIYTAVFVLFIVLTFLRNQVWKDSVTLFKDIAEKYPKVAHAHFVYGKNLFEIKDFNGALAEYNRSIDLDTAYPDTYIFRGNLYFGRKNYLSALADYKKAVELKPEFTEALYNLGLTYLRMNRNEESIAQLNKCIALNANVYMYQSRGAAHSNLKQYKEAMEDFSHALNINPALAESLCNRGVCYYYLQQIDNACADWHKALSLGYSKASELIIGYCK